jgi:hypothetical protein
MMNAFVVNSPYDDHVDALTNLLSEAPNLGAAGHGRSHVARVQPGGLALASRPMVGQVPIRGATIVRDHSIFGPIPLPDFSNKRSETQPRTAKRSRYAAEDPSEPIYGYDGVKWVRLK